MELLVGSGTNLAKQIVVDGTPKEWCELVTLDWDDTLNPHVLHDLNVLPYPFDDCQFDEIHAYEVLEHVGKQGDWRFFFGQFEEFHRILKPGGLLIGTTPMWDCIWAWGDPGHTRVISEGSLLFLSQKNYSECGKSAMTDYRPYYRADFEILAQREQNQRFCFVVRAVK